MTEPRYPAPDPRDVDPRAVRRGFARAAATYDAAAALQREISGRMAQRLDYVRIAPAAILDAGCGTGEAIGELAIALSGRAAYVAFDIALPMVEAARRRARTHRSLLRRLLRPLARRAARPRRASCAPTSTRCRFPACASTSCGAISRCSGSTTCRAHSPSSGAC